MPIRIRLDRMLLERRMSLGELADRVGVTAANLSILKTGRARAVRFTTLDALCRELACQPGDLLAFEPQYRPAMLRAFGSHVIAASGAGAALEVAPWRCSALFTWSSWCH